MVRPRVRRAAAVAAAAAGIVVGVAACSNDNNSTPPSADSSSASPNATGRPALPTTIGSTAGLIAMIDSDTPCTDTLTTGITRIIANTNFYDSDHPDAGTAKIVNTRNDRVQGVPTCTFTIDPGNTTLPTTLRVGALTAAHNTLTSAPTTAAAQNPDSWEETSTAQTHPGVGSTGWDRIAAAVNYLGNPPRVTEEFTSNGPPTGAFSTTAAGQINADGATFAARGITTENTTPVDGYFITSTRSDATTTGEVGRVGNVIFDWMRGEALTPQSLDLHGQR